MPNIVSRKLRWGPPNEGGGFTGFNVYYGLHDTVFNFDSGIPYINVGKPEVAPGVYEVAFSDYAELAGLPEGNYDFAVTAYDAAGNESDFAEVENVPLDLVAPGTPTNLEVIAE